MLVLESGGPRLSSRLCFLIATASTTLLLESLQMVAINHVLDCSGLSKLGVAPLRKITGEVVADKHPGPF